MARPRATLESTMDRFFAKVAMPSIAGGCWLWAARLDRYGYGRFKYDGIQGTAHRYSYIASTGPIPGNAQLDHLCRVRRCVNPAHLEPVTSRENTMRSPIAVTAVHSRQTHCKRGHEFTPENTYLRRGNSRLCRECARAAARIWSAKRRATTSE